MKALFGSAGRIRPALIADVEAIDCRLRMPATSPGSGLAARRRQIQRPAIARVQEHAPMRHVDARLLGVRQPHHVVVGAELARMLLVRGRHRHLIADVLDQLIRIHHAVLVLVRRAFQSLDHEVAEDAVPAAELRPFERNLARAAGQQSEKIALDIAELLDVGR